ncbi:MAG: hypothetical protein GQ569_13895 [Methylococcaceae bacterium]|nr:hypothetical protein [Methylococcaceae bacterium]
MPYTIEDFQKDVAREHLHFLSADEVIPQFSTDEVLKNLSLSERLKGLSKEEVDAYFQGIEKLSTDNKH